MSARPPVADAKKLRVLIVDDSSFFRHRLAAILASDPMLEVVGSCADGEQAVALNRRLRPDVITMDIEMPVMGGIEAVREIMRERAVPILMLSAQTHGGARATMEALEAGALDFMPKEMDAIEERNWRVQRMIRERVLAIGLRGRHPEPPRATGAAAPGATADAHRRTVAQPCAGERVDASRYSLLLIGASTGGPRAVQQIITGLPRDYPLPVLIVQHMPATFTHAFAERMDHLAAVHVMEAEDGQPLRAGNVYIAPGGRQLEVQRRPAGPCARVYDAPDEVHYRPCVDVAFASAAAALRGKVLAVVLTGMGRDGCEGAGTLKRNGATVWAQDEASSIIYGMPKAVAAAGVADRVLSLDAIAGCLQRVR